MLNDLLLKTRKLSTIIQNCSSKKIVFDEILDELRKVSNSSVVLIDKKGRILNEKLLDSESLLDKKELSSKVFIENQLNDQLKNIVETKENISLSGFYIKTVSEEELKSYNAVITPVNVISERLGTIIVYNKGLKYELAALILIEYISSVVGLMLLHSKSEENAEELRKMTVVKSAIGTLSYSELEAILHIFEELNGNEGLLVASKVADKVGITRSVIVNALRKFESAGVIESRSLGMKGTYIKILNDYLIGELDKLKK